LPQNNTYFFNKIGFPGAFAAPDTSGQFKKQRHSLRGAFTVRRGTMPTFKFRASLVQHSFAVAAHLLLQRDAFRHSGHS